jgi:hypothetical protein
MPFTFRRQAEQKPLKFVYDPHVLPEIVHLSELIAKPESELPDVRYLSPKVKAGRVVTFDVENMQILLPVYAVPMADNYPIDLEEIHTLADWHAWWVHLDEKVWFTDEIKRELNQAWRLACRTVFGDEAAFEKLKPGERLTFPCPYDDGE